MAEKPGKVAKKVAAKALKKVAVKAIPPKAKRAAGVAPKEQVKALKPTGKVSAKPSAPKKTDVHLPKFDPAANWSTAPWINDPALLAQIRAAMAPESIGYPEALPDVGRAVLNTFEAAIDVASSVAPLRVGERYALATRRDGTFILYTWP